MARHPTPEQCSKAFPMVKGDFPMKNGDFPMKNGDFPMKNGDLYGKHTKSELENHHF